MLFGIHKEGFFIIVIMVGVVESEEFMENIPQVKQLAIFPLVLFELYTI